MSKSRRNHSAREKASIIKRHLLDKEPELRLKHKDSVIAEITEDYVKLKKNFGEN